MIQSTMVQMFSLKHSSRNVVPGSAASAYPCGKCKPLGLLQTYGIESRSWDPEVCIFTSLPGDSDVHGQVWEPQVLSIQ